VAEQAVDAGYIARYERLKTALGGVAKNVADDAIMRHLATRLEREEIDLLAHLIERYAGPDGASRTATVFPLPMNGGKHRKQIGTEAMCVSSGTRTCRW
jgi:hypothetical protein